MAILDLKREDWLSALSIDEAEVPRALILEGTWWRKDAEQARMSKLDHVRESAFPEIYLGRFADVPVAYCCAYGAARAVEPAHVFAQLGTPLMIQLGTCGTLNPDLVPGMVVVPDAAAARDGLSPLYGAGASVALDAPRSQKARAMFTEMGVQAANARHLTWPSLFAQSDEMCTNWASEGLETIDMELAAVGAVASMYGSHAVGLLSVWDGLSKGHTFLDPLEAEAQDALASTNNMVFDIALELARDVPGQERAG